MTTFVALLWTHSIRSIVSLALAAAELDTVPQVGSRKTRIEGGKKFNFQPETTCLFRGKQEKATALSLDEHIK